MNSAAGRVIVVAGQVLRANRLLLILLLIWPCLLTAILLLADRGQPDPADVGAILQQELFYGLALISLGASVALGNEERAHRAAAVLARAVGRVEYLTALGLAAWLPFAAYLLVWMVNGAVLAWSGHLQAPALAAAMGVELLVGLFLGAAGLFFSAFLPQLFAAGATGVVLAILVWCGSHGVAGDVGKAFAAPLAFKLNAPLGVPATGPLEVLGCAVVVWGIACMVFLRRDLRMKES